MALVILTVIIQYYHHKEVNNMTEIVIEVPSKFSNQYIANLIKDLKAQNPNDKITIKLY